MNIYIAYKFTNIDNKKQLREKLHKIAKILEKHNHNTFILGRDLQKWEDYSHPIHHKTQTIFRQIKKSNCIVAFVESDVFSKGLMVEMLLAKLFSKNIVLVVKKGIKANLCRKMAKDIFEFKNFEDIEKLKI